MVGSSEAKKKRGKLKTIYLCLVLSLKLPCVMEQNPFFPLALH